MLVSFFLNNPNIEILICKLPGCEGVELRSAVFDNRGELGNRTLVDSLQIKGKPEQLLSLADAIYEAFGKKEVELPPQPTADDEAANDFERLQQARANTPEANMELPERKTA